MFSLSTDGTRFKLLHVFSPLVPGQTEMTNWDGATPQGSLVLSGHTLYGVAWYGGVTSQGTVFSLNTNGEFFTVLHTFAPSYAGQSSNPDGARPNTCFVNGGVIYGTTQDAGANGGGVLFSLTIPRRGSRVSASQG